jgi:hypothetical protein
MATLNLKRPSGSWGEMPPAVWNEISGTINQDWSEGTIPDYTKFFTYGLAVSQSGETGVLQLSQSVIDSWHYNLGAIGLTATSAVELEYDYCEPFEPYTANSASGCFPTLPDDVTSHN